MHYIRCLRPPKILRVGSEYHIELLFIISTDLGDSLLNPDEPVPLVVKSVVNTTSGTELVEDLSKGKLAWKSGQRVCKQTFKVSHAVERAINSGRLVDITIGPTEEKHMADTIMRILDQSRGRIMSLHVMVNPENDEDRDISLRNINCGEGTPLSVAEDIGEPRSLARHVWDGGVVAASILSGSVTYAARNSTQGACTSLFHNFIYQTKKPLKILELGCGVGVLGLGVAFAASRARKEQETVVLMTDLADAEEQVRGNIARNEQLEQKGLELLYENLDWDDGRQGRFGPLLAAHRWDLIMFSDCTYNVDVLPALVETLDALHSANQKLSSKNRKTKFTTTVLMATKPRHSSEEEVFKLLDKHGWTMDPRAKQSRVLPVLGGEDQSVQLYLLEKP